MNMAVEIANQVFLSGYTEIVSHLNCNEFKIQQ